MFTDFERKIAQKMALDIRYFCSEAPIKGEHCQQGVTKLPTALADLIQATDIGAVVLFAENLVSNQQIIQLTHDLQKAALMSKSAKPLIISIDQEGGRVVRLPHATSFAGNMAIGATYVNNKTKYASSSSRVIGAELNVLGINNNYAPVIDVNTNADNPVINTRSFGENPQQVAELGVAAVNGLQAQGVMATLKHFPGHGDTSIDSHLGLPRVDHDLALIEKTDLAPFKWVIEHSDPAMIMTAHIQYPALDSATITSNNGDKIIRPATMSRKILTDLLRDKMAFKGIIATDALDMAGIAHYFDKVTATVETLSAGADLAVMPFKIRAPEDIAKFKVFVQAVSKKLADKIAQGQLSASDIDESLARLNHYKEQYIHLPTTTIAEQVAQADKLIASEGHLAEQQLLANSATTLLKNNVDTLPIVPADIKHIHLLVANEQEQQALQSAIVKQWQKAGQRQLKITSIIADQDKALAKIQNIKQLIQADLVIATMSVKAGSVVDLGGIDDLLRQAVNSLKSGQVLPEQALSTKTLPTQALSTQVKANYGQLVQLQMALAKEKKIKSLLIAQGSPFLIKPYLSSADAALLMFDDKVMADKEGNYFSAGMNASIAIVIGQQANGVLPVTLK
ncbi:beta-hexosaminidase [Colwellia sp. 39_35_sub15_T18]|nr:beta-hexosaminidase [Colwellia sp. 39_35_sub15_T18]